MKNGDYVLATKYSDGDPKDQWCVGFWAGLTNHNPPRHNVVDKNGQLFRSNGFQRVKKISQSVGEYILNNKRNIEQSSHSVFTYSKGG